MLRTVCCVLVAACAVVPCAAEPFTYQGSLEENGQSADGSFDFVVEAFAFESGGTPVGAVTLEDVAVEGGVFTVEVDFGTSGLPAGARWLQLRVRDGASTGGYTVLTPRQAVNAAPYAAVDLSEPWTTEPDGALTFGADAGNEVVLINRDTRIGQEFFGIGANTSGFAGMYISTSEPVGMPFYGYAAGENIDAYTFFDGAADRLLFNVRGGNRLALDVNGAEVFGPLEVSGSIDAGGTILTPVFRADAEADEIELGAQGDPVLLTMNGDSVFRGAGVFLDDVVAPVYQYSSPRSKSVTVGFAEFSSSVTSSPVFRDPDRGLAVGEFGSGVPLLAPVSLPEGAVIQSISVYVLDNSTARGLRVGLYRRSLTSFTTQTSDPYGVSTGSISGQRAPTVPVFVGIPAEPVVQENDTFFIQAEPTGGDWTGNADQLSIRGVRVEYEIDRVD